MGAMHGGSIFAIMDYLTTVVTIGAHPNNHINVSAEINMSYHGAAMANTDIYIISEATKVGRRLAFSECKVYNENDEILYRGHQTHAVLDEKFHIIE